MTPFDYEEERALARNSDPKTSHDAAEEVDVTKLQRTVLDAIKALGGATSAEVANYTRLNINSINPRMRPLAEKGLILDTGRRRRADVIHYCHGCQCASLVRRTRPQIVWRCAR